MEKNSHVHSKRETTHFHAETANGRRQNKTAKRLDFLVCGKNKCDFWISLMTLYFAYVPRDLNHV